MKLQVRAALAIATLALLVAVSGIAGAIAGQVLITGKQIRNGTLTTQDYKKGSIRTSDIGTQAVRSADLQTGAVQSVDVGTEAIQTDDIGANQVTPSDVQAPAPQLSVDAGTASAQVGTDFVLLDPVQTYTKQDPTSVLEVTWTGSASAGFSPCQFQLRVDGQAAAAGAGVIYVANGSVEGNVSVTVSFAGLPAGPHEVAVFARSIHSGSYPCTVGPAEAQMQQTFVVAERVI